VLAWSFKILIGVRFSNTGHKHWRVELRQILLKHPGSKVRFAASNLPDLLFNVRRDTTLLWHYGQRLRLEQIRVSQPHTPSLVWCVCHAHSICQLRPLIHRWGRSSLRGECDA